MYYRNGRHRARGVAIARPGGPRGDAHRLARRKFRSGTASSRHHPRLPSANLSPFMACESLRVLFRTYPPPLHLSSSPVSPPKLCVGLVLYEHGPQAKASTVSHSLRGVSRTGLLIVECGSAQSRRNAEDSCVANVATAQAGAGVKTQGQ